MPNEIYDIVVVGSGFAGLSAAIEAGIAGSSVLVIEKMKIPGGNSALCGGLMAVANSPLQKSANIVDTPTLLAEDMLRAGQGLNHPEIVQIVAQQSSATFFWVRDYLGVAFSDQLKHGGGHSVPRTCTPITSTGASIVQSLLAKCRDLKIEVRLRCAMQGLITDKNNNVVGITVIDSNFSGKRYGLTSKIKAKKAVIIATGGYCEDVAFRTIQNPCLDKTVETTNHSGATAEALVSALKIGAMPVHLSWIQMGPWTSRDEKGWGVSANFSLQVGFPYGILIDATTGKRFTNELTDRLTRYRDMILAGRDPMLIVGGEAAEEYPHLKPALKRKVIRRYESLESLAIDLSINLAELSLTILEYNRSVEQGYDHKFGKPFGFLKRYKVEAPYYLVRLKPKIHYCNGGLGISTKGQVLDIASHKPIVGLLAAGEVTGGVHGACRLDAMAVTECLVFGRIAGITAAKLRR